MTHSVRPRFCKPKGTFWTIQGRGKHTDSLNAGTSTFNKKIQKIQKSLREIKIANHHDQRKMDMVKISM